MAWIIRDLILGIERLLPEKNSLTLGRNRNNDIVIPDESVRGQEGVLYTRPELVALSRTISRVHSRVTQVGDVLWFADENASNGTYLGACMSEDGIVTSFTDSAKSPIPRGGKFSVKIGSVQPIYFGHWPAIFYHTDSPIRFGNYHVKAGNVEVDVNPVSGSTR